jgi:hypothetical protein
LEKTSSSITTKPYKKQRQLLQQFIKEQNTKYIRQAIFETVLYGRSTWYLDEFNKVIRNTKKSLTIVGKTDKQVNRLNLYKNALSTVGVDKDKMIRATLNTAIIITQFVDEYRNGMPEYEDMFRFLTQKAYKFFSEIIQELDESKTHYNYVYCWNESELLRKTNSRHIPLDLVFSNISRYLANQRVYPTFDFDGEWQDEPEDSNHIDIDEEQSDVSFPVIDKDLLPENEVLTDVIQSVDKTLGALYSHFIGDRQLTVKVYNAIGLIYDFIPNLSEAKENLQWKHLAKQYFNKMMSE